MGEILELTEQAGVTLRLARVKPAVHELLRRDGFLDRIGDDRTHGNVNRAVEAQVGEVEIAWILNPEESSDAHLSRHPRRAKSVS